MSSQADAGSHAGPSKDKEVPAFSKAKIAELVAAIQPRHTAEVPEASRITVHATISRFAVLYEKIRNAVDYKDDHLLRKAAIVRILRRQLVLEKDASVVALQLIRELIAARYLPNGVLSDALVGEVARVIHKFQAVAEYSFAGDHHRDWLLGIVAAELEELVDDHSREKAIVHFLFEQIGDRVTVKDDGLDETERRLQVYVACHRALSKADDEMLAYKLVRAYHSIWMHPEEWMESPENMAERMRDIERVVRAQLAHPLAQKFFHAIKPWAIALGILRDVLAEHPEKASALLEKPNELHVGVRRVAERRMRESRGKLRRGIWRAIVYLFFTKMVFALAIEIPFERLLFKGVHNTSLAINLAFPPFLMFLVGSLIRVPGKENVQRIEHAVDELLSVEGPKAREIRSFKNRGGIGRFTFRLIYLLMFLVTFGLVFLGLSALQFTWVSALIFLFFLCVVSFFAFRLRLAGREYVVVDRADKLRTILLDFFSLPILRAGQWLSSSISRINVFIFLFDFVIETPFKIFLNILEDWFAFMKEKKEELQ